MEGRRLGRDSYPTELRACRRQNTKGQEQLHQEYSHTCMQMKEEVQRGIADSYLRDSSTKSGGKKAVS